MNGIELLIGLVVGIAIGLWLRHEQVKEMRLDRDTADRLLDQLARRPVDPNATEIHCPKCGYGPI